MIASDLGTRLIYITSPAYSINISPSSISLLANRPRPWMWEGRTIKSLAARSRRFLNRIAIGNPLELIVSSNLKSRIFYFFI